MGAVIESMLGELSQESDWELILRWRRCDKHILGYGIIPGKFSGEGELEMFYSSILKGLEGFEYDSMQKRYSWAAKMFGFFSDLEFEVQSRSLLSHFPPEALRGMTLIQYRKLFLRYAHAHPETVQGGVERTRCIERMAKLKIIRQEWYDHRT